MPERVTPQPFSKMFDLNALGHDEKVFELAPNGGERDAIAAWAGLDGLESFTATVRVRRAGSDQFDYRATFAADVVQACVVTLVPMRSALEGAFERQYRVLPGRARRAAPDEEPISDDGEIETLTNGALNLATPVLEELVLAIDPYPRAPGAEFESPQDDDDDEPAPSPNPFAVLGKLKGKD